MGGRKRRKAGAKAKPPNKRPQAVRELRVTMRRLEVVRGYDGPLRGAPEPALLVAIYRIAQHEITMVARRIVRVPCDGRFPEHIELDEPIAVRIARADGVRVLVLAVAFEEDDGTGITRVYTELEDPAALAAWRAEAHEPEPMPLLEWARTEAKPAPCTTRVHLVNGAGDLRDAPLGDDWIGAALFVVADEPMRGLEHRLRFVSHDARNDWTAIVEMRAS